MRRLVGDLDGGEIPQPAHESVEEGPEERGRFLSKFPV
jgi:hypothetical protein